MPKLWVQARSLKPTTAVLAEPVSSSEAVSLKGHKAKTPIYAGSIIGGLMGLAWIIGFTIYFVKRYRRKKLQERIAAGEAPPKKKEPKIPEEKIIIPPDPAVLLGHRLPGQAAFKDEQHNKDSTHVHSDSGPSHPNLELGHARTD